jgi:hypothetical protein
VKKSVAVAGQTSSSLFSSEKNPCGIYVGLGTTSNYRIVYLRLIVYRISAFLERFLHVFGTQSVSHLVGG